MRMLQSCDEFGLCLESAYEVGIVGKLRPDDLYRDLATDGRLIGAKGDAEAAFTNLLSQLISPDRETRPGDPSKPCSSDRTIECWVGENHLLLEFP